MKTSLRFRLVIIILTPLLVIAALLAIWAFLDAQARAEQRFDRSLLSAALAVSRDVALSEGDALSPATNALLRDTSNGAVFYHVFAPDGVFVTGYATPPLPRTTPASLQEGQFYFDGIYFGEDVRALRFFDSMQIDGLTGEVAVTVWQPTALRAALARDLSWQTFQVISGLIIAVALIVWFGVRRGLKPLLSLQAAIERRSPDDLTAIQRQIPVEASGIVATLNRLFRQLTQTIDAKDVFISNAAHQLQNPIAGVVAMSEALSSAKTPEDMQERAQELKRASRHVAELASKMLTLERARAGTPPKSQCSFDLVELVSRLVDGQTHKASEAEVHITHSLPPSPIDLVGDETMISEGITNLIENGLKHGGDDLDEIHVRAAKEHDMISVSVTDNGIGIPESAIDEALERFSQVRPSNGSGLGLAIARVVAEQHGGSIRITPESKGVTVTMTFAIPRVS